MKRLIPFFIFFATYCLASFSSLACTDFRLIASDNTVLISRSMEFALDLKSNIRTSPRGRVFTASTVNGKPSMSWTAKYGYIYVDGLDQDFAIDGMNEMGLSFEALYLPGEAQYQSVPAGKENLGIPYLNFGDWLLSSFKTVDEVKAGLANIFVFTQMLPGYGDLVFPLHFSVYDASGKGIIVEYTPGKMNVYDNEVGMLTNSPTYPWQVSNLQNYLNLSPYNPQPIVINGLSFGATGQGAGMLGLPGDISPPSRFVKVSFMRKVAYPMPNATGLLNLAEHIINNVDIPMGLARSIANGKESAELTQWVVFKDLSHKQFYYRTYNDMGLRHIALEKINFAEGSPRLKMPMLDTPHILDVTNKLLTSKP